VGHKEKTAMGKGNISTWKRHPWFRIYIFHLTCENDDGEVKVPLTPFETKLIKEKKMETWGSIFSGENSGEGYERELF